MPEVSETMPGADEAELRAQGRLYEEQRTWRSVFFRILNHERRGIVTYADSLDARFGGRDNWFAVLLTPDGRLLDIMVRPAGDQYLLSHMPDEPVTADALAFLA
jgi:hypothetical protein